MSAAMAGKKKVRNCRRYRWRASFHGESKSSGFRVRLAMRWTIPTWRIVDKQRILGRWRPSPRRARPRPGSGACLAAATVGSHMLDTRLGEERGWSWVTRIRQADGQEITITKGRSKDFNASIRGHINPVRHDECYCVLVALSSFFDAARHFVQRWHKSICITTS